MTTYTEVTQKHDGEHIYIKSDNVDASSIFSQVGKAVAPTAYASQNTTYTFRKMGKVEFDETMKGQKLLSDFKNPRTGEKWLTEHLDHSRVFKNAGVTETERVAEIALNRRGYKDIRSQAIPQAGSKVRQPAKGDMYNLTNTERLAHRKGKLNVGLKGKGNVEKFNRHVLSVSEVDPHSFMNKNEVLMWCRRNKIRASLMAVGIAIDIGNITISAIEDDGRFGAKTQVALGEIIGGTAGAEAAVAVCGAIGSALGSIVPGIGNVLIGFIGSLIGSIVGGGIVKLIRLWFCGGTIEPGPGPPLLDTEPKYVKGVPDSGLNTQTTGVPPMQMETTHNGAPSLGLDTGARGYPGLDFKTTADRY